MSAQSPRHVLRASLVALLICVAPSLVGVSRADSYYGLSFKEKRGLVFDRDGGAALLDQTTLLYIPRQMDYHVILLPALPPREVPQLLALDRGVWLRAGRTIAYASLAKLGRGSDSNPFKVAWQTALLGAEVDGTDETKWRSDADGSLLLEVSPGTLLKLTPSERGLEVQYDLGALPPRPELGEVLACIDQGTHMELQSQDRNGNTTQIVLPEVDGNQQALCPARLVNERGRVWFESSDYVFTKQAGSLLVIAREKPADLWSRLSWPPLTSDQLEIVFVVLVACLSLWLGVLLIGERPRYRPLLRVLGASVVAPPFAFITALCIDTIGIHGSPALFFAPVAAGSALLPTVGVWAADLLGRDRDSARHGKRSVARAFVGTLAGGLVGVSLLLYLLTQHGSGRTAALGTLIASTLIGFGTALGYGRGPSDPTAGASTRPFALTP